MPAAQTCGFVLGSALNPILRDHDERDLYHKAGKHSIKTVLEQAEAGQVSVTRDPFPEPGSTVEEPETAHDTRLEAAEEALAPPGVPAREG